MIKYIIQRDDNGRRIDRVLRKVFKHLPLSAIYKAIRKKHILLNGRGASVSLIVRTGDEITLLNSETKVTGHSLKALKQSSKYSNKECNGSVASGENAAYSFQACKASDDERDAVSNGESVAHSCQARKASDEAGKACDEECNVSSKESEEECGGCKASGNDEKRIDKNIEYSCQERKANDEECKASDKERNVSSNGGEQISCNRVADRSSNCNEEGEYSAANGNDIAMAEDIRASNITRHNVYKSYIQGDSKLQRVHKKREVTANRSGIVHSVAKRNLKAQGPKQNSKLIQNANDRYFIDAVSDAKGTYTTSQAESESNRECKTLDENARNIAASSWQGCKTLGKNIEYPCQEHEALNKGELQLNSSNTFKSSDNCNNSYENQARGNRNSDPTVAPKEDKALFSRQRSAQQEYTNLMSSIQNTQRDKTSDIINAKDTSFHRKPEEAASSSNATPHNIISPLYTRFVKHEFPQEIHLDNNIPIKIIFEDDNFLVIDKPYGMLTQGGGYQDYNKHSEAQSICTSEVKFHCINNSNYAKRGGTVKSNSEAIQNKSVNVSDIIKSLYPAKSSFQAAPLHRLDRLTSGILVISKSLIGARAFSYALEHHIFYKTYIGIVRGDFKKAQRWEDALDGKGALTEAAPYYTNTISHTAIKCDQLAINKADVIKASNIESPAKKSAATVRHHSGAPNTRQIKSIDNTPITVVEYKIFTGRKHQIRRHSSMHGYPLIGDTRYGGDVIESERAYFLHATRLNIQDDVNCDSEYSDIIKVLDRLECLPPFL